MNKLKLEDESFLGKQAETLTTNPAFQAALTRIKAKYFEQFGSTGMFQGRKRDILWRKIQMFNDFEQELAVMLRDGYLADQDIEQDKRLKSVKN